MEVYEREEKVQIIKWYYCGNSVREVINLFTATFENRPSPSAKTIRRFVKNFETHGCVSPRNHKKRPPRHNDEMEKQEIMVCASDEENSTQSIKKEIPEDMNLDVKPVFTDVLRVNEIKTEFVSCEPSPYDEFEEHTVGNTSANIKSEVEEEEIKPEIITFDDSHLNEIKKEFVSFEPERHDGFMEHTVGSTGTNIKLEVEEADEVKPEIISESSLLAIVDSAFAVPHLKEIKKELLSTEPNSILLTSD